MDRLDPAQRFPVKGIALSAAELVGDAALAAPFERGPAFIARLCPVDYHRFHFPDGGRITRRAFGVTSFDLPTFSVVGFVLLGMTLLASWLPARRAMSVDPNTAMRDS